MEAVQYNRENTIIERKPSQERAKPPYQLHSKKLSSAVKVPPELKKKDIGGVPFYEVKK